MHQFLKDILRISTDTILPSRCVICRTEHPAALCPKCVASLTPAELSCSVCGKPSLAGLTHPPCATRTTPLQVFALFNYRDRRVAKSVIAGKYNLVQDVFQAYGVLLGAACAQHVLQDSRSIICPVPLHRRRLAWRGFNQAAILGTNIANALRIPYAEVLTRARYTKQQKDLRAAQRAENVDGCFTVLPTMADKVTNAHVILVDDVYTTGNTMSAAAKTLREAGATHVSFVTLAKE